VEKPTQREHPIYYLLLGEQLHLDLVLFPSSSDDRPPSLAVFPSKSIVVGTRTERERHLEIIVYFVALFF
jgi:hypothetical protein